MTDMIDIAIKLGEARMDAAMRIARSTSASAARMTLEECKKFIQAYNGSMYDSDPRKEQWEQEIADCELLAEIEEHEDYMSGRK